MNKNIEIINAELPLLEWVSDILKESAYKPEGAYGFISGINGIIEGKYSSLMIEQGKTQYNYIDNNKISCGTLTIYISSRRVVRDGKEISLTPKEFDILYFLAKNRGEVFTKEQIYQAVWDDKYLLDDSNIMAFIRKIRKKIEPDPDAPQYILTIWGIGYKFSEKL